MTQTATIADAEVSKENGSINHMIKDGDNVLDSMMLKNQHRIQPMKIQFKDISFVVKSRRDGGKKTILNSMNGSFISGELSAIMGPSGAGKSSLMNVITGTRSSGFQGDILFNGRKSDAKFVQNMSCYIKQHDFFIPYFTVLESLMFSANLRLRMSTSAKEINDLVDQTIELLNLNEAKETRACDLSGGERKRLSIALELISNPPVMFFDEPTSGLDSASCLQCISLLKRLAQAGRIIVCVIHQPSSMIFNTFDRLYLVAEGRCIYRGLSSRLVDFLSNLGMNCPSFYNPADYVLEIATGKYGYMVDQLVNLSENGRSEEWSRTQEPAKICDTTIAGSIEMKQSTYSNEVLVPANTMTNWGQFILLWDRSLKTSLKDLTLSRLRPAIHVLIGVLVGLIFQDLGNDATHVYHNVGLVFISQLFLVFTAMMGTILTFHLELPAISRETMNNWYSLPIYYLAKTVADLPFQIVYPAIFVTIAYFMTGQPMDGKRFMMILFISILTSLVAQSYGLAFGVLLDLQGAVFVGPVSMVPFFIFSGFMVNYSMIPIYLRWLTYIFYVGYGFEANMITLYGYDRPSLNCSLAFCHFKSPVKVLELFETQNAQYWVSVVSLTIYYVVLRIATFFMLRWRVRSCS